MRNRPRWWLLAALSLAAVLSVIGGPPRLSEVGLELAGVVLLYLLIDGALRRSEVRLSQQMQTSLDDIRADLRSIQAAPPSSASEAEPRSVKPVSPGPNPNPPPPQVRPQTPLLLPGERALMIEALRSGEFERIEATIKALRDQGWLMDGTLRGVDLSGAELVSANWVDADLEGADLSAAKLNRARFDRARLARANLRGATLQGAGLLHADLEGADLSEANLAGARLTRSTLTGANFSYADLEGTQFLSADLRGALFDGANLRRANLQNVQNLSLNQLMAIDSLAKSRAVDGSPYDGRFKRPGDLAAAAKQGIDPNDSAAMARFYGVSEADYLAGQAWIADRAGPTEIELEQPQSGDDDHAP
ncbi:MAG: pentapeptide repeat-containing protein [Chloroflexi bacterium]|nr:pentapeptide repeat-containing protein [Chloroflexota bacterium]